MHELSVDLYLEVHKLFAAHSSNPLRLSTEDITDTLVCLYNGLSSTALAYPSANLAGHGSPMTLRYFADRPHSWAAVCLACSGQERQGTSRWDPFFNQTSGPTCQPTRCWLQDNIPDGVRVVALQASVGTLEARTPCPCQAFFQVAR